MKSAGVTVSKENYLKTILQIKKEKGYVRAADIAAEMKVSNPSVSRAVRLLEQENYIRLDIERHISFTPYGLAIASEILERYSTFYNFLVSLGISEDTAALDAGRMEHAMSNESFLLFKKILVGVETQAVL